MKLFAVLSVGILVAGCEQAYAQAGYYSYDAEPENVTLAAGDGPMTAGNGMTLYTFDKDSAGTSACYDDCAVNWPPYLVEAGASADGLTAIARADGTQQWAKDGAPLYFWIGDTAPGDMTGDGVGGVWHVAK